MSAKINSQIAKSAVARYGKNPRGKKRDNESFEFMVGAWAALEAAGLEKEAGHLGVVLSMLIAPRGFAEIERIAKLVS